MRVNVKQTEWIRPASQRHLQTPLKQSQHLSRSVLCLMGRKPCKANEVQKQLYAALKTNTEKKHKNLTSFIIISYHHYHLASIKSYTGDLEKKM